jgi:lysophospholipase L1-like esterase
MRRRRTNAGRLTGWVLVAAAVLVGAVVPACSSVTRPKAILVGDSISALGARPISGEIGAAGWRVTIDAESGVTTSQAMPALGKAAVASVDANVVELGTNDSHRLASGDLDGPTAAANIAAALDLFGSRCIIWVNVDADPSRPGGPGGAIFNAALAAEAVRRPNLHVADMNAILASSPGLLAGDQVHFTAAGSTALGQLIAREVARCRQ